MASDERRRQLVGLGLKALTERPIHEVSLDDIAGEAGISRSLLFHYFPSKTAFYEEVVAAAGRRVARTVHPDDDARGDAAIDQFLERWIAQIERRRALYLALVRGNLADLGGSEVAGSLRERMTRVVVGALAEKPGGVPGGEPSADLVHAWLAYVEDLALAWSSPGGPSASQESDATSAVVSREDAPGVGRPAPHDLVRHCHEALLALLALDPPITRPTP